MSDEHPHDHSNASHEEIMSALFATLVLQTSNMALMYLGHIPNPQNNEHLRDLDAAKMFIDQLEMLEFKTRGNLNKNEAQLLKQSLTAVRMAFVEAADQPPGARPAESAATAPISEVQSGSPAENAAAPESREEESKKKFTKKY